MKIAIQIRNNSFSENWLEYCKLKNIEYKLVNVYQSDIIQQVKGCTHFLWHWSHGDAQALKFARQLIQSIEKMGIISFPSTNECWHFDDKLGQKYLLEALNAPVIPSYVFYSKDAAKKWVDTKSFPIVFKLRGGAGSANVKLVCNRKHAYKLINKSFSNGFRPINNNIDLNITIKKIFQGKIQLLSTLKLIGRFLYKTNFEKLKGNEIGYIYFQEFIPNNSFDIRIIVIGDKAIGIKRMVRKNDFRASGSGIIAYDKDQVDMNCLKIAFEVTRKLEAICMAYDFVFNENNEPLIVEMSYAFSPRAYDNCEGYWDSDLNWYNIKITAEQLILDYIMSLTN